MSTYLAENAVLVALIWMLLANLFAVGPRWLTVVALVAMLVTAGPIIAAVVRSSGWLVGFPLMLLMLIQMRWSVYFIARLLRHYGLLPPRED